MLAIRTGLVEIGRNKPDADMLTDFQELFAAGARVLVEAGKVDEPVDLILSGINGATRIASLDSKSVRWAETPTALSFAITDRGPPGSVVQVRGEAAASVVRSILALLG